MLLSSPNVTGYLLLKATLKASVEQHASFLKAQGLLLLKEAGSLKRNMEGRAVLLKTSTDKKGAVNVDRMIFRHIYSAPV